MKILLISHVYPPNYIGGTEMSTHAIAREFKQAGHKVQVLCADKWGKGKEYFNGVDDNEFEDIPVTRIRINWRLAPDPNRYLYENPLVEEYLLQYLPKIQPDIVHITSCVTLSASLLLKTATLGYPLILTLTDFWFICPRIKLLNGNGELCDGHVSSWECLKCLLWDAKAYRWPNRILNENTLASMLQSIARHPKITRIKGLQGMAYDINQRRSYLCRAMNVCDRIIVKSKFVQGIFQEFGVSLKKLVLLPDGEDTSWGKRIIHTSDRKPLHVGYIGHIISVKGVHVLIEAFNKLRGGAELLIYGDQNHDLTYSNQLSQLAGKNENIRFRGSFNHNHIDEILSQIDVLVVPSIWPETFSHVIREGFIALVPVIGSDIGAIPEVIEHNKNGFLFNPGEADQLSKYLQMIIDDPEILTRLKKNIPEVKTSRQQSTELITLYKDVIEEHSSEDVHV